MSLKKADGKLKELFELSAPKSVKRKRLEKDVQKQCVDWARARGYWARKFSSMTSTAEPDYLFALETVERSKHGTDWNNVKFACEFKAPGKTSTELQQEEQGRMRDAGWFVFECDNFELFKDTVLKYEAEYGVHVV